MSILRSFLMVNTGATVTATTPRSIAVSQVRPETAVTMPRSGNVWGRPVDEPVEQEPAHAEAHRSPHDPDHQALDDAHAEHRSRSEAEREHRRFLACALVDRAAGGAAQSRKSRVGARRPFSRFDPVWMRDISHLAHGPIRELG
jgi:hypothetical protein